MPRTKRPSVVIDTGPLVAAMDTNDDAYEPCSQWLEQAIRHRTELLLPTPVITEVCYLLEKAGGKSQGPEMEAAFLELLGSEETFTLYSPDRDDLNRMAELVRQYRDFPLGAADAAVVATAERHGTNLIATIDHRHFHAITSINDRHFTLVPEGL